MLAHRLSSQGGKLGDVGRPEAAQGPKMPENLRCGLDQLVLTQVKHKASGGESLDCFKCVLQHLLLSVPIHGYVVQVDNYGQGTVVQPTT